MRGTMAFITVFLSGFAIMVLEIIGARYLARDFGSSFYVWVSQIGVVMMSLALGYFVGGALADRIPRPALLAWFLIPTGIYIWFIPDLSPRIIDAIIMRHPVDESIPMLWRKLDPALGSAVIFLVPGFVLALLGPFMIRFCAGRLDRVGSVSGFIYAASTVGSIAGVFVSGYVLIDHWGTTAIFRGTGVLGGLLGLMCLAMRGPCNVVSSHLSVAGSR